MEKSAKHGLLSSSSSGIFTYLFIFCTLFNLTAYDADVFFFLVFSFGQIFQAEKMMKFFYVNSHYFRNNVKI